MTGMLGHIGIGKETTWGTGVAVTDYVESLSESVVTNIERFETRNIYAGIYEPDDSPGLNRHEGDIVFAVSPRNVGHFLNGCLGVSSPAVVLSGFLYTNAFTPTQTIATSLVPLPSYTLEVFRPGASALSSSSRYAGAVISKLAFNLKPNQDLRCTASVIAQARTGITKTTASFPASPTQFFTWDVASVALAGAAYDRFGELNIEFDNQLEGVSLLDGSNTITRIRRTGAQMVRIGGSLEFEDFTDYNSFLSATEQALKVTLSRASSFQMVFDVPRMIYTAYPVTIGGRGRLSVNFEGMARYHVGSANAIKISVTNVTTY